MKSANIIICVSKPLTTEGSVLFGGDLELVRLVSTAVETTGLVGEKSKYKTTEQYFINFINALLNMLRVRSRATI